MNTIEQQGDEMVERFVGILNDPMDILKTKTTNLATRCAIRSCEDTIEELEGLSKKIALPAFYVPVKIISDQIAHQKKLIEYLKTKLNG